MIYELPWYIIILTFINAIDSRTLNILKMGRVNSRCCCNETPPMAGQNLDYFTHTSSRKSAKLFSRKLCHAIRPRSLTQSSLHSIHLGACYRYSRVIQHTLVINMCVTWQSFLVNIFADFQYSVGKKYQDFIQSLLAFPYSNICY